MQLLTKRFLYLITKQDQWQTFQHSLLRIQAAKTWHQLIVTSLFLRGSCATPTRRDDWYGCCPTGHASTTRDGCWGGKRTNWQGGVHCGKTNSIEVGIGEHLLLVVTRIVWCWAVDTVLWDIMVICCCLQKMLKDELLIEPTKTDNHNTY